MHVLSQSAVDVSHVAIYFNTVYFSQIKNLSLYTLYYAEACSESVGFISASLHLQATQLLSKKCHSDGEPLATLCPI